MCQIVSLILIFNSFVTFRTLNKFKLCVPLYLREFKGKGRKGDGGHVSRAQVLRRVEK